MILIEAGCDKQGCEERSNMDRAGDPKVALIVQALKPFVKFRRNEGYHSFRQCLFEIRLKI